MSRDSVLARGRTAAEFLMIDTCTVVRASGESASGGVVTETTSEVYSGKCRLQVASRTEQGSDSTVGEAYRLVARKELQLPMSAPQLEQGDQVTMTAAAHDPQLVGRQYRVRDVLDKTDATSRRVTVLEVTS